jgi:hypothetical protein
MSLAPLIFFGHKLPIYFEVFTLDPYAPGLWLTVKDSSAPAEATYAGKWVPDKGSRSTTEVGGKPFTFGEDSFVQVRADHTFEAHRMGRYDGYGRLICLVSEKGTWMTQPTLGHRMGLYLYAADGVRFEHVLVTPQTFEQYSASLSGLHDDVKERDLAIRNENEANCNVTAVNPVGFEFFLAHQGSTYALYQAAGTPYTGQHAKTVLLERAPGQ